MVKTKLTTVINVRLSYSKIVLVMPRKIAPTSNLSAADSKTQTINGRMELPQVTSRCAWILQGKGRRRWQLNGQIQRVQLNLTTSANRHHSMKQQVHLMTSLIMQLISSMETIRN